ncbi:MAG: Coenzyme F420 hydrogenase/dehydrogenase, beta subunit C-terminal domain [Synergistaceae bacterium]|nr:Coenzyme F420 hydrogenase/dehydrogenase, beta subunit C-terminal domain [Synergistaceae bacterium]
MTGVCFGRSGLCFVSNSTYWGGGIFGACYSPDFRTAEYAYIDRLADLGRLKGSKYIPTLKRVLLDGKYVPLWPLVAEKLKEGREILFTGLGCDVAALKSYLKANHVDSSRLYTVDLICYGPVIPEVHRQYIETMEKKYRSRLKSFTVRHKARGWVPPYIRAEFEDGKEFLTPFYDSDYGIAFSIYTREHCCKCRFKGAGHQADITVGDYWGLTPEMEGWNHNGVSIFLVRTEKGRELLSRINQQDFALREENADFAVRGNPMYYQSRKRPEDYGKFCDDLMSRGLHRAVANHQGGILKYWTKVLARKVKGYVPPALKRIIKRMLRKDSNQQKRG